MSKTLQTRQQHYDTELEKKKAFDTTQAKLPPRLRKQYQMPEMVKPGDVSGIDNSGNKLLVRDDDLNHDDVRYIDPETGLATPWVRVENKADLDLEWDYLTADA